MAQPLKKIDITITCVADMFRELLAGRVLVSKGKNSTTFRISDGKLLITDKLNNSVLDAALVCTEDTASNYEVYIEAQWYDNIPKRGIMCWVWDHEENDKTLDLVLSYDYNEPVYKFGCAYSGNMQYAVPLTFEEAKRYIIKR